MEEIINKSYDLFGAFGLVIACLITGIIMLYKFLIKIMNKHEAERCEWKKTIETQFTNINDRQANTEAINREHIGLLQEIKGFLQAKFN